MGVMLTPRWLNVRSSSTGSNPAARRRSPSPDWHRTGRCRGTTAARGFVKVVRVEMRDDHDLGTVDDLIDRVRQVHGRIALGRVAHRSDRVTGAEHRVDQKVDAAEAEAKGGVADECQVHGLKVTVQLGWESRLASASCGSVTVRADWRVPNAMANRPSMAVRADCGSCGWSRSVMSSPNADGGGQRGERQIGVDERLVDEFAYRGNHTSR